MAIYRQLRNTPTLMSASYSTVGSTVKALSYVRREYAMKQVCSLFGISILLSACCLAQSTRDALVFLTPLRDASLVQNADAYAALFASNGKWDGPFGQNAIGPLNITTAIGQFFTEFGPLREVQSGAVQLSPDIVLADVYQMTNDRHP